MKDELGDYDCLSEMSCCCGLSEFDCVRVRIGVVDLQWAVDDCVSLLDVWDGDVAHFDYYHFGYDVGDHDDGDDDDDVGCHFHFFEFVTCAGNAFCSLCVRTMAYRT